MFVKVLVKTKDGSYIHTILNTDFICEVVPGLIGHTRWIVANTMNQIGYDVKMSFEDADKLLCGKSMLQLN